MALKREVTAAKAAALKEVAAASAVERLANTAAAGDSGNVTPKQRTTGKRAPDNAEANILPAAATKPTTPPMSWLQPQEEQKAQPQSQQELVLRTPTTTAVTCSVCNQLKARDECFLSGGSCRCKPCNALKTRLRNVLVAEDDADFALDWNQLDRAKKQRFFEDSHALVGSELKAAMQQIVTETREEKLTISFKGNGKFYDADDLKDLPKYKGKPDQLASVMKNCYSFECQIRGVRLYEDMEYVRSNEKEQIQHRVSKRAIETTSSKKADGANKAKKNRRRQKVLETSKTAPMRTRRTSS